MDGRIKNGKVKIQHLFKPMKEQSLDRTIIGHGQYYTADKL